MNLTVPFRRAGDFREAARDLGPQGVKLGGASALLLWLALPEATRAELYRLVYERTKDADPNALDPADLLAVVARAIGER